MTLEERILLTANVAGAVLHAISGPLQQTVNLAFVLRRTDGPTPLPRLEDGLERLSGTVERLRRIDIVRRPLCRSPVTCAALVDRLTSSLAAAPRLRITTATPAATMILDLEPWSRACAELVDNALHFSEGEVLVTVSAGPSPSVVVKSGTTSWSTPPNEAVDPLHSTKGEVLGLGLAIAHMVATAHGGHLEIAPDRGEVSITADAIERARADASGDTGIGV